MTKRAQTSFGRGTYDPASNEPDAPTPELMQVHCYNVKDGCTNVIEYRGVGKIRKLCLACQERGTPSERFQAGFNYEKAMRKLRGTPMLAGLDFGDSICFEVTCWPKTFFDGRVT